MQPQYATIESWTALTGIGRTTTYKLLTDGHLRAVKVGTRTLIDVPSGLAWIATQPAADINLAKRKAA